MSNKPLVGITMGDPAGIGPEIAVKALSDRSLHEICSPFVIGDAGVLSKTRRQLGSDLRVIPIDSIDGVRTTFGAIHVLHLRNVDLEHLQPGRVSEMAGRASYQYIETAIRLAMQRRIDATVTGPIHKEAINRAGYHYAGHTEIYAELTQTKDYSMMLVAGDLRVAHVSTHVSLREACDRVRKDRILITMRLADEALRRLGFQKPRMAVAGLNPHCGEGGLFGTEDRDEILPAVEEARWLGIQAEGPIPSDTVFSRARGGQFDVVIAMYHDQGHIPVKLLAFELDEDGVTWKSVSGVNITLGLPIVRVSVDHGTAFDIVGQGKANCQSLLDAVRLAARLATV